MWMHKGSYFSPSLFFNGSLIWVTGLIDVKLKVILNIELQRVVKLPPV